MDRFKSLKPLIVEMKPIGKHIQKLLIVSEFFKGMTLSERMDHLNSILVKDNCCYIYEPFTMEEFERAGLSYESPIIRLENEGGVIGLNLVWNDLVDVRKLRQIFGERVVDVLKLEGDFVRNEGKVKILLECLDIVLELEGDSRWFWLERPEFGRSALEEIGLGRGRHVLILLEQLR